MTVLSAIITPTNIVTASNTLTLTNKTINGTNNTITNVNLATGVTGTLPAANGGTGLTSPGANGNVLTSNGSAWVSSAPGASLLGDTDSATPFETSLGYQAGDSTTGVNNTFIGYQAGLTNSTGTNNTALGFKALNALTGSYATAVGSNALLSATLSGFHTAVGADALRSMVSASGSTAVGYAALRADTGGQNVAIGESAGRAISTGTQNVVIGYSAGFVGANQFTTGQNCIIIGYNATPSSNTVNSETTIGNSSTTAFRLFGDLQLQRDYTEKVVTANTGTAYTIDITNGTLQILTLTGSCTFTFPTATAGKSFILFLKQDGTGGRTATWPASVKWPASTAPTITSTANRVDKYIFTADGTNWLGSNAGQNYTV